LRRKDDKLGALLDVGSGQLFHRLRFRFGCGPFFRGRRRFMFDLPDADVLVAAGGGEEVGVGGEGE
jgi:hypothetical protein